MSTSVVEVSGEKAKAWWDKRLIEIFCDIHISNDVHIDENSQKRKTHEISTSCF
ncbi:hypothetical protein Gotur_008448 [Gossypium turneri]